MNKPLVSVIIPFYNTEKFIKECLNSVLNQTLKNIEILCIDDGSTDYSHQIVEKYSQNNKRIKLLTQKNQGAGIARNNGIKISKGEYIVFMDSDDKYPYDDILETLYKKAKENNALIAGGEMGEDLSYSIKQEFYGIYKKYKFQEEGFIKFKDYQFNYGYTRFIYKKDFLIEHNIFFPRYLRYEDPIFFVEVMHKAKEFYAIPKITYAYRINHKILVWNATKVHDLLYGIRECLLQSKKYNYPKLTDVITSQLYNDYSLYITKGLNIKNRILLMQVMFQCSKSDFFKRTAKLLFSIKNNNAKSHKTITILGLKINFRRRKNVCKKRSSQFF